MEAVGGAGGVLRCAHTGIAAFNMGAGAETINSLFSFSRRLDAAKTVHDLVERLAGTRLLIID